MTRRRMSPEPSLHTQRPLVLSHKSSREKRVVQGNQKAEQERDQRSG